METYVVWFSDDIILGDGAEGEKTAGYMIVHAKDEGDAEEKADKLADREHSTIEAVRANKRYPTRKYNRFFPAE